VIGIFILLYLRGKLLQTTFRGVAGAIKEKKETDNLMNRLIRDKIIAIDINSDQQPKIHIDDTTSIEMFQGLIQEKQLCKLSKKSWQEGPTFIIHFCDGEQVFKSYLLASFQEDVFIRLVDKYEKYCFKIPGLRNWLRSNLSVR
jgi:hypothetical protein